MRTRRGLGVILNAEDWQSFVPQSFQRLVVQIDVTEFDVGGQPGRVDREAVVLGRYLDFTRRLVSDRVIGATVAELELEGLGPERLAEELMAQANPENRDSAALGRGSDERSQCGRRPGQRTRIAGSVRDEDAVW